jgi:predicted DNA binding CopG/RHH family protein
MSNGDGSSSKAFRDFSSDEWRKRPRRDASGIRSRVMNVRLTPHEYEAIKEQAELCGMNVSDYVVCRCLRLGTKRVQSDNVIT